MALLLSGLLSSGMSDEADAREGAAGGRIGGRRGKNRRGHDKNRNNGHKRKKNNHNAPGLGSSSWIYVRMVVENLTSADLDFEGLALYEEFAGKICRVKALQTIRPNEAISFAPVDHEGVPTSALQAVLDDKYRLDEMIGSGGFGAVYRAMHLALGRTVAVKVLRPSPGNDSPEALSRFRQEAISTTRLNHPNAVTVMDFGVSSAGIAYPGTTSTRSPG